MLSINGNIRNFKRESVLKSVFEYLQRRYVQKNVLNQWSVKSGVKAKCGKMCHNIKFFPRKDLRDFQRKKEHIRIQITEYRLV